MDILLFLLAAFASFTKVSSNTLYYGSGLKLPDECYEPFSCSGKVDGWYRSLWNCEVYIHCHGGEIVQGKRTDALEKSSKAEGEAKSCTTLCTNQPPTSPPITGPTTTTTSGPCSPVKCDLSFFAIITDPCDCCKCYGCFHGVQFGHGPCPGIQKIGQKLAIEANATLTNNYVREERCASQCTNPPTTTIGPTTTEEPTAAPSTTKPGTVATTPPPTQTPSTLPSTCLEPFSCAGKDGYYSNPGNCSLLFICKYNQQFTIICPTGYQVNPITVECEPAASAGCAECTLDLPAICLEPFVCTGKKDGPYSSPWNCETYYICLDGNIFTGKFLPCSKGTWYDPVQKACRARNRTKRCTSFCPNQPPVSASK